MGVGSTFLKILNGFLQATFSVSTAKLILEKDRVNKLFENPSDVQLFSVLPLRVLIKLFYLWVHLQLVGVA